MKKFRTISACLLAILVMMSSTSFMVGLHLCAGEVQNVALFSKAAGCEKEQDLPPCHRHMTAPCCEDESVIHSAQELKAAMAHQDITAPFAFVAEPTLTLISEIIPEAPVSRVHFQNYDPPLPSADLTLKLRVFLI